jgi:hypothetical protein
MSDSVKSGLKVIQAELGVIIALFLGNLFSGILRSNNDPNGDNEIKEYKEHYHKEYKADIRKENKIW